MRRPCSPVSRRCRCHVSATTGWPGSTWRGPPRDERVLTTEQQLQRVAILRIPAGDAPDAVDERVERRALGPVAVEELRAAQQPPCDQGGSVDPADDRLQLQPRGLE